MQQDTKVLIEKEVDEPCPDYCEEEKVEWTYARATDLSNRPYIIILILLAIIVIACSTSNGVVIVVHHDIPASGSSSEGTSTSSSSIASSGKISLSGSAENADCINFIENGSFEDILTQSKESDLTCKKAYCSLSQNAIAPWYETNGQMIEVDNSVGTWAAKDGQWSLDLNPESPIEINQVIRNLEIGNSYTLIFYLYRNPYCDNDSKSVLVRVNGANPAEFTYDPSVQQGWKQIIYSFKATTSQTIISIKSTSLGTCGPVVDAFSVTDDRTCPPPVSTASAGNNNPSKCVSSLVNGDFEDLSSKYCDSSMQSWCTVSENAIAPWFETSGKNIELNYQTCWSAHSGVWSMDLNSNVANTIQQNVNVDSGVSYTLVIWVNGNPFCDGNTPKTFKVSTNNVDWAGFTYDSNKNQGNWIKVTYQFTSPVSSTSQIQIPVIISSTTTSTCGPVIDDLHLVKTSDPNCLSILE